MRARGAVGGQHFGESTAKFGGRGDGTGATGGTQPGDGGGKGAGARPVQEGHALNAVLDALQAKVFITATRVAESLVHRRAGRLGTQRLVQELRSKGLDDDLVRATAERLRATEHERAQAVWRQRFGSVATDAQERARQMRFLAARGFSGDVVRRVVRDGSPDDEPT